MMRSALSSNLVGFCRSIVRPLSTSTVASQEATTKAENLEELFYNTQSSSDEKQEIGQFGPKKKHSWGVNRVELLGGVAADPEILSAKSGDQFAAFRMYTNVDFRKRDGTYYEQREVHDVQVFMPSLLNYIKKNVKKGNRVYVSGRLHYIERPDFSRRALVKAELVQTIAKAGTSSLNASEAQQDNE